MKSNWTYFAVAAFIASFGTMVYVGGAEYALWLMTFMVAHELGHYVTAKRYRLEVSLPMFIPFPVFAGTFGAIIKIKSLMSVQQRFDVGLAGPAAGLVVIYGMAVGGLMIGPNYSLLQVCKFGTIVTTFNLLPIWQFDGGHIFSAMRDTNLDKTRRQVGMLVFFFWLAMLVPTSIMLMSQR